MSVSVRGSPGSVSGIESCVPLSDQQCHGRQRRVMRSEADSMTGGAQSERLRGMFGGAALEQRSFVTASGALCCMIISTELTVSSVWCRPAKGPRRRRPAFKAVASSRTPSHASPIHPKLTSARRASSFVASSRFNASSSPYSATAPIIKF